MWGLQFQTTVTEAQQLWTPQDTLSQRSDKWVREVFRDSIIRRQDFLVVSDGDNVLTKATFDQLWELDDLLRDGLQAGDLKYSDVCKKVGTNCLTSGALGFWGFDKAKYNDEVNSDADLLRAISSDTYSNGGKVDREILFSQDLAVDSSDNVLSATAIRMQLFSEETKDAITWETEAIKQLPQALKKLNLVDIKVHYLFQESIDIELAKSVNADILLVIAGYVLMCTYTGLVLFRCSATRNRAAISIVGVVSVVLGIFSGFGICAYLGVPFSSLTSTLPFILLGIGIDDMFIIMSSLDNVLHARHSDEPDHRIESSEIPKLVAQALAEAGVACTVTSVSDLAAFLLGSLTRIPAVEWFCIYAAISITCVFIMQFTFLVAFVSIDMRRLLAGRMDLLWCISCKPKLEANTEEHGTVQANSQSSWCQKCLSGCFAPAMSKKLIKIAVILIFLGCATISGIWMTQLKQGLPLEDLATTDSYVQPYFQTLDDHFITTYTFGLYYQGVNFESKDITDRIVALTAEVQKGKYVKDGDDDVSSWIEAFRDWCKTHGLGDADGVLEGSNFTSELKDFLGVSPFNVMTPNKSWKGLNFNRSVVWQDGSVRAAVVNLKYTQLNDADRGPAFLSVRKIINESDHALAWESENSQPKQFQYSFFQVFWEQDIIMIPELVQNFILASAAVFFVVLLLLAHFIPALLAFISIAMINLDLMGLMYLLKLNINSISVICLVMSIGLAVDYTAHYLHAFMAAPGASGNERMKKSLVHISTPVFSGGITTFLGVAPLVFSKSVIFQTFFKMFCGIIGFGLAHGLVFSPVVISLLNPQSINVNRKVEDQQATDSE